ncbi:MAG: FAD-dependent oxidoreductase [Oscillospiraceae bacterium]
MAFRSSILKLASKISIECGTYTGITPSDPEYMILDPVVTDEMAEIGMHIKVRSPRSIEEIAKKAGKPLDYTQKMVDMLAGIGMARCVYEGEKETYYYPIWVPGIMEGMLTVDEQVKKYPVIAECFERYTKYRTAILVPNVPAGMGPMRVMPVGSAIASDSRAASYDEVDHIIERAWAISVGPCSCRRTRRIMGEGCGHLEEDMCLYIDDNAKFFVKQGSHRLVSKDEARAILKRAEDNGLVHEINAAEGVDGSTAICNCCGCSCFALRLGEYFNHTDMLRSNYVVRVDRSKCVACGLCMENCQMGALKLGQKLCATYGEREVVQPSAYDTIWTKNNWNVDYRTNRKNVTESGTAPCKVDCPAHIPVQGYIKLASQGRYLEALELIKNENPFPAVCGRICNRACEDACTRGDVDSPIAIDEIKKFIADKELSAETRFVPKMLNQTGKPFTEKIAVIGGGPSGLSCAYYLAVKGYPVTVFEKNNKVGGMLTGVIPEFRLEKNVVDAEIDVLRELGVEFKCGVEVGKDVTVAALREEGYKAFYLAAGAWKSSKVGCAGDDMNGVFGGVEFLYQVGAGNKPEIGKNVAVIGGGNTAMDVSRTAVRLGAEKVYVIYRRTQDEMPAAEEEYADAVAEGAEFKFLMAPAAIIGDGRVRELKLQVMELGEADASGRRKPVPVEGKFETLSVDSVIAAIGQSVELGAMLEGSKAARGKNGTVVVDPVTLQTGEADIFAGGDVVTGASFAINAIAAGKEGAVSIHRFVHEGQDLVLGRDRKEYLALDRKGTYIPSGSYKSAPRQKPVGGTVEEAKKTFSDLRGTFTEEQMKRETERCLGCGAVVVDEPLCVGCGICTTKCKFDALKLERVRDVKGLDYDKLVPTVAPYVVKRMGKIAVKSLSKTFGK